eukprot:gene17528-20917_t
MDRSVLAILGALQCLLVAVTSQQYSYFGGNGHYYEYVSWSASYQGALDYCSGRMYSGLQGIISVVEGHMMMRGTYNLTWNDGGKDSLLPFICEYGGMKPNDPIFTDPINTFGSKDVLIKRVDLQVATGETPVVMFTNLNRNNVVFNATNVRIIPGSSEMMVDIPGGTGVYQVKIITMAKTFITIFQYLPPTLLVVYTNIRVGELVTVKGYNFGSDTSLMSLRFGDGTLCSSIHMISRFLLTCTLPNDITGFYPLKLTVDSIPSAQPYIIGINNKYYAVKLYRHLYQNYRELALFLNRTYTPSLMPFDFTQDKAFMTSVQYKASQFAYTAFDGPDTEIIVDILAYSPKVDNPNYPYNAFHMKYSVPNALPTNDTISFLIGFAFDPSINGVDLNIMSQISPWYGGPYIVKLSIDNVPSSEVTYSIQYYPPRISMVTLNGQRLLIQGNDFYKEPALIQVTVGGQQCTDVVVTKDHYAIECSLPLDPSNDIIVVSVGGQVSNHYSMTCKDPSCSGHGTCTLGQCICSDGWDSPLSACSVQVLPSKPPVIDDSGATSFSGGRDANFSTNIEYLRELDTITGKQIKLIRMSDIRFLKRNISTSTVIYLDGSAPLDSHNVQVNLTVKSVELEETVVFAGQKIALAPNSVKYLIDISGWPFTSQLNTLQVIYKTVTRQTPPLCQQESKTPTATNSSNLYEISTGGSILFATFANNLYVDGRISPARMETLGPLDVLVQQPESTPSFDTGTRDTYFYSAINVPHFTGYCQIDPSFKSMLVVNDKGSSVIDPCNDGVVKSWTITIIIPQ